MRDDLYLSAFPRCFVEKAYTQFFEWLDNNPNNEDRRGYFVTFAEGDKIRIANSKDDYILGVVSIENLNTGNTYALDWHKKFLTDSFGERLIEDVEIPETTDSFTNTTIPAHTETRFIINPDYDESENYVARNKRQEWAVIGTHGQLVVIDDGTCEVNHYCAISENGTATKADSKTDYRVIERIDDMHIRIVIK